MRDKRIEFIPYQPFHLAQVRVTGPLAALRDRTSPETLVNPPLAWTCLVGHRVVGCAGVFAEPDCPWRALGWALVGDDLPLRAWPAATARARDVVAAALTRYARIEINVARTFLGGLSWARRLGFEPEGIRTAWFEDGTDGIVFGRIRPGRGDVGHPTNPAVAAPLECASTDVPHQPGLPRRVGVAAAREAVPT